MKPELLYLTPVVPALTGNGLAMRAGMVLEALAAHCSVSLLTVRLYAPIHGELPEPLARLCKRMAMVAPPRRNEEPRWAFWKRDPFHRVRDEFSGFHFDTVHVFRMAMLPYAERFLTASVRRHLDLDDIESVTRARIAALCRTNGDATMAAFEAAAAERSRPVEQRVCQVFDRVYVCSEADRSRLLECAPRAEICVLPNGVRLPATPPLAAPDGDFSFLFAGTLGYYPNEDAVRYLAAEIVPRMRQNTSRPFIVRIVGKGASPRLREAAEHAGLVMDGEVPDMAPYYARASAMLVPLRAAGGTRIKILESWSYRRPVVTTSVGIEGLAGRHDEHVLIGNTPEEFADQCVRLMEEPGLCRRLADNAHALLLGEYTAEVIERTIGELEANRSR